MFRRGPIHFRSAPLLAVLLGFLSAPDQAWPLERGSFDLATTVREAPRIFLVRLAALIGLAAEDSTPPPPPPTAGSSGGVGPNNDAGVIIDPNGPPRS
ncbi:MAG TPA: hypothetical protein VN783_10555 [Thermoanaerobaculia bacterium]|nr:hypothetical protein [Thermoanaerobaculia bacterium]